MKILAHVMRAHLIPVRHDKLPEPGAFLPYLSQVPSHEVVRNRTTEK